MMLLLGIERKQVDCTHQLPLPLPPFFVLVGSVSAWPDLPKNLGSLVSRSAVPSAMPAWSRSVNLWERVTMEVSMTYEHVDVVP